MNRKDGRILVIDDEPNIRKLLAGVLEDEGYSVETVADAESGEVAVRDTALDLILLDVMLPGRDGLRGRRLCGDGLPALSARGRLCRRGIFVRRDDRGLPLPGALR